MIKRGYSQEEWLLGVERFADKWLSEVRDGQGVDVVSLGPGEGEKECRILRRLVQREQHLQRPLAWLTFMPVDLSMPLSSRRQAGLGAEPVDVAPGGDAHADAHLTSSAAGSTVSRLPSAAHRASASSSCSQHQQRAR
jgi:hypothetical protein